MTTKFLDRIKKFFGVLSVFETTEIERLFTYTLYEPPFEYSHVEEPIPTEGVCGKCGRKWDLFGEDKTVKYVIKRYIGGSSNVGKIEEVIHEVMIPGDVFVWFVVTNPSCRDTRYDPSLIDWDIYEEINPVGYRGVKISDFLIDGDTLEFSYIRFYHEKCV